MNTIARCLMAVAVSVTVGGLAATPVSADGASPAIATTGYVRVVDDTGALSLEVPVSWSVQFTRAVPNDDWGPLPTVAAAQPGGNFPNDVISPSVLYSALPFSVDPRIWRSRPAPPRCT